VRDEKIEKEQALLRAERKRRGKNPKVQTLPGSPYVQNIQNPGKLWKKARLF
jgi:hypothetical protein